MAGFDYLAVAFTASLSEVPVQGCTGLPLMAKCKCEHVEHDEYKENRRKPKLRHDS